MSEKLKVVPFPGHDVQSIPESLRRLAAAIEEGKYGEVENVAWVLKNTHEIKTGLLGACAEPLPSMYFILAQGMRWLEK